MPAKVRRIDFSPDEWLGGTRKLTFEQEGFYIRVCALIYSNGGPLPHGAGDLARACRADPRKVARLLGQLLALGKIRENDDGTLTVPRCEVELTSARLRAEVAEKNAANRWENIKTHDARARTQAHAREAEPTSAELQPEVSEKKSDKPRKRNDRRDARARTREAEPEEPSEEPKNPTSGRSRREVSRNFSATPLPHNDLPDANHQPSGRKIASPKELAILSSVAGTREATPPLPSQGDGGAAPRSPTPEPAAQTSAFDDPALRAEAIAGYERVLDAIRGKLGTLEADATTPPPPDPTILAHRARLVRLNTLAGERLSGETRMQAWEAIAQADAFTDPNVIPPPLLAELAAIESLAAYPEAAE